jgi:helicase required for RNAi-mediated heterochromatin assembly 1
MATVPNQKEPLCRQANRLIRQYGLPSSSSADGPQDLWLRRPEIPDAADIIGFTGVEGDNGENIVEVPVNNVDAPWESKGHYLRTHYELLREDAIAPLRDAVREVRLAPGMSDSKKACIYDKVSCSSSRRFLSDIKASFQVFLTGFTLSHYGPAARVIFSTARSNKKILWEQSKRLLPGTLVALSWANNKFKSQCIIGVVAARPLTGLQANPPEVDLFFARPDELDIDTSREWLMVEARSGYFEATRHTLLALQKLREEKQVGSFLNPGHLANGK